MKKSEPISKHLRKLSREELSKIEGGIRMPFTGSWACCKNDNENDCKGAVNISHDQTPESVLNCPEGYHITEIG